MKTKLGTILAVGVILLLLVGAFGNSSTGAGNTRVTPPTASPVATPAPASTDPATLDSATLEPTPTEPTTTEPAPTEPATTEPAPAETKMVVTPAPVEEIKVVFSGSDPGEYTLEIVSGLPGGCAKFTEYATSIDGNAIAVTVTNLVPAEPVPCTAIYGRHEGDVRLSSELMPGETYSVTVNGEVTNAFTVRDESAEEMVEAPSPIDDVAVKFTDADPPEYVLVVVSRLPLGSSCSRFNGYDVTRPASGIIEVRMTHLEIVAQNVPCTEDYPAVSTGIPLGTDFTPGEAYKIAVNGEMTNNFTARTPQSAKMAVKTSPVHSAEILILESAPPRYQLVVISRLPLGSSCSQFNGYDVSRPFANNIQVIVTHLEVTGENVPCTRDLPVVETNIPLGSNFDSAQEYTITIVEEETLTFTAQ